MCATAASTRHGGALARRAVLDLDHDRRRGPSCPRRPGYGQPIRSASANFTPARSSRSSMTTSTPASASSLHRRSATGVDDLAVGGERQDGHLGRSDAHRPHDAVLVVVLLDDGGERARDAHAVAAHDERLLGAVLVGEGRAHGLGVLRAELEDLRDLDAAGGLQRRRRSRGMRRRARRSRGRPTRRSRSRGRAGRR